MDDDDDVPDELWDILDTISHQKNQPVSQAPNMFQQQRQPAVATNGGISSSIAGASTSTQWRPNLVQQLPLAAPAKPKSLAQQLLGDNDSTAPSRPGFQAGAPGSTAATQQRWTPPPQVQQQPPQPPWASVTPGSSTQFQRQGNQHQQQQQWPGVGGGGGASAAAAGGAAGTAARGSGVGAVLAAELGLPPLQVGLSAATTAAGAAEAAAGAAGAGSTQQQQHQHQQQPQQQQPGPANSDDFLRLQQEAEQLRSKLMAAEREKQQLQHEKQLMQQRMTSQSQHSMAQHRAQDLQRQVTTYQERLRFAEQEAAQAQSAAAEKSKFAKEAEVQLKQLQSEVRRKEDELQQLQVELEQEKQRTERLAAATAATAAAAGGGAPGASGSSMQALPLGFMSPKGPGSSGRKRRGSTAAAGTPALSSAVKAAASAHVTRQQQLRQQQMAQLLGGAPAASVSFDLDMYDVDDEQQQPEQEQQVQQASQQRTPAAGNAAPSRDAAVAAASQQQQQAAPPQQLDTEPPGQQQERAGPAAAPQPQPQQQQQQQPASLSSSFSDKLVPALQRVQIRPQLSQLLWNTCQPAMQQLLQPMPSQLVDLDSMLAAAAGAAAADGFTAAPSTSSVTQSLSAALAAAQQQLSLLTAGAVSGGSALLLSLLRLGAVLVPDGPVGVSGSGSEALSGSAGDASVAAAAVQAAFPAAGDQQRPPSWLLLPLQQQAEQKQPGQVLLYRSALDAAVLHVLPLPLTVAVLQLVQHLACLDSTCLSILAAQLTSSTDSSSSRPSGLPRHSSSSSRVKLQWMQGGASVSGSAQDFLTQQGLQQQAGTSRRQAQAASGMTAAGHGLWGAAAGLQATPAITAAPDSSGSSIWQQQQQRSVGSLLADAAGCHSLLLQHAGALLAAVADELPVTMQPALLPAAFSTDQGLLLMLLQADSCGSRCAAAALLQLLVSSPEAAAALTAALTASGSEQQREAVDGEDVVMIDVTDDQAAVTALQPLNHRTSAAARPNNKSGKAQQQQGAAGSSAHQQQQQQQQHKQGAQQQQLPALAPQAVQEVLLQLLDCFSYGLEDAFQALQQSPAQQPLGIPSVLHATTTATTNSNSGSGGSLSHSLTAGGDRVQQAAQGWSVFELQRRTCTVFAGLLHARQELLLQYSMDQAATAGYGLAQRLLVMVDAACSPVGGDPFAVLTPQVPSLSTPTAAAGGAAGCAGGTVCGSPCSWQGCMERVRLAHEGLLLLRALVATAGPVGTAAMADLSSNSTSLRLIMTTRAKLAEVTTALTAAAAAATAAVASAPGQASGSSSNSRGGGSSSGSPAAADMSGVSALPLQSWGWPWSAQCGAKTKGGSSSGGNSSAAAGQQLLRVQHPLLQSVLQEMANTAASIHRRVMIYLRSQEGAMQS